jgi:mannose-1-phosphate guanylyltransferase
MEEFGHLWAILLAAGDGNRVRSLTSDAEGAPVPKQFWSWGGHGSLMRQTIGRAAGLVPLNRIVPVVASQHRQWWERDLADLPPENIVIQPQNKGTAAGILLPFMHIVRRDPLARFLVLPCDHFVENEDLLREALVAGLEVSLKHSDRVVLLGMQPEASDPEYGWIVPEGSLDEGAARRVSTFIEKPDRDTAQSLARRGGLLNSLILVASARALLQVYDRAAPQLVARFVSWREEAPGGWLDLEELYRLLPPCDFSHDVLEQSPEWLSVLPVSRCGWVDLGTPNRLRPFLGRQTDVAPGIEQAASAQVTAAAR